MDLTREEAVRLFHEQWSDMQKDLGDNPDVEAREAYKAYWCRKHGFNNTKNYCFLCEYSHDKSPWFCHHCPVKWPTQDGKCISAYLEDDTRLKHGYYLTAPISEILALPEREEV